MARKLILFAGAILWMQIELAHADDVRRTVTVSAQSEIAAAADEALVVFRIHTEDPTLLDAAALNDSRTRQVLQKVKELGIADEYLRMIDFDVSRHYLNTGEFKAFHVDRKFACRIHDFALVESLLSDLFRTGVEHIDRVKYQLKNQRLVQHDARKLAFEIAKEKATSLAELSELKLGKVISVKEDVEFNQDAAGFGQGGGMGFGKIGGNSSDSIVKLPASDGKSVAQNMASKSPSVQLVSFQQKKDKQAPAADDKEKSTLLPPGMLHITATVMVEFELADK